MALRNRDIKIILIRDFCTGCLLTIRDMGSKEIALYKILGLEFLQLISGIEKGNFIPKKKKKEKLQMLTFKYQRKLI